MGHFLRCVCGNDTSGRGCYADRITRIAEALERNPPPLAPSEKALAEKVFDSGSCLSDEQLLILERRLFPKSA